MFALSSPLIPAIHFHVIAPTPQRVRVGVLQPKGIRVGLYGLSGNGRHPEG